MKSKYLYIKLSLITALLIVVFLWGIIFLIPSNRFVYNANNKVKELKRKVLKYKRDKSKFEKTNAFEMKIMQDLTGKFEKRFYEVKSKEDMIKFYRKLYSHIQHYEKKAGDRIENLQITTETDDNKLSGRYRNMNEEEQDKTGEFLSARISGVKTIKMNLKFNGKLKDALNFINHITWSDLFILISKLEVTEKYKLSLKVYYIDKRVETNEQ
jgi:hypothetical protein